MGCEEGSDEGVMAAGAGPECAGVYEGLRHSEVWCENMPGGLVYFAPALLCLV